MRSLPLPVGAMQGVEECAVDQYTGVDHRRWPNKELSEGTGESEPNQLGRKTQKELISQSPCLVEMDTLGCNNIGRVRTAGDDVGHDSDEGMLFDIERAWVERPSISECSELRCWQDTLEKLAQWKRSQLGNKHGDVDRRI